MHVISCFIVMGEGRWKDTHIIIVVQTILLPEIMLDCEGKREGKMNGFNLSVTQLLRSDIAERGLAFDTRRRCTLWWRCDIYPYATRDVTNIRCKGPISLAAIPEPVVTGPISEDQNKTNLRS